MASELPEPTLDRDEWPATARFPLAASSALADAVRRAVDILDTRETASPSPPDAAATRDRLPSLAQSTNGLPTGAV